MQRSDKKSTEQYDDQYFNKWRNNEIRDGFIKKANINESGTVVDPDNPLFVPNVDACSMIADYYHQKYDGMEIIQLPRWQDIAVCIQKLRESGLDHVKVGFIVTMGGPAWIERQNGETPHVIPIVYEKKGGQESLIYLDSLGKGSEPEHKERKYALPEKWWDKSSMILQNVDMIKEYLQIKKLPNHQNIRIRYNHKQRQADGFSCVNDAFAVLKAALLEEDISKKLDAYQTTPDGGFRLPETWAKSVQLGSAIEGADFKAKIQHKNKPAETLAEHRERYKKGKKGMHIYLANKGKAYFRVVRKHQQGLSEEEKRKIYEERSSTKRIDSMISEQKIRNNKDNWRKNINEILNKPYDDSHASTLKKEISTLLKTYEVLSRDSKIDPTEKKQLALLAQKAKIYLQYMKAQESFAELNPKQSSYLDKEIRDLFADKRFVCG